MTNAQKIADIAGDLFAIGGTVIVAKKASKILSNGAKKGKSKKSVKQIKFLS